MPHRTIRADRRLWILGPLVFSSLAGTAGAVSDAAPAGSPPLRAVILMIADGAGYSTLEATRAWTGHALAADDWIHVAVETSPLRTRREVMEGEDPLAVDPELAYDPERAWSAEPDEGEHGPYANRFSGYAWLRSTSADSAATATALSTGVRTYSGAINVDGAGNPLRTLAEVARDAGRNAGVVTSVPFNHATPAAGGGAHAKARSEYHAIGAEMFEAGALRVIGGCGHPEWGDNGELLETPRYSYIDMDTWAALTSGTLRDADGTPWTLVQDPADIRALAQGATPPRLAMIARSFGTLQQGRESATDPKMTEPGADPERHDVPQLRDLALAALNALDDDEDGLLLVVEGGAVDWAMHGNQLGRMIEEYIAFDEAVHAVERFVDNHDQLNWDNTLIIVTADHDHLLFGPESDRSAFQPIESRGTHVLPGHLWHSNRHGNQLVPAYLRGAGAESIAARTMKRDPRRGSYLHQTVLGKAMIEFMAP